jgi:hypothetical protein
VSVGQVDRSELDLTLKPALAGRCPLKGQDERLFTGWLAFAAVDSDEPIPR